MVASFSATANGLPGLTMKNALIFGSSSFLISSSEYWKRFSCGAAMCYIFKSLKSNRILNQGDTIALGTPIFTPYLEMAHLEDYDLHFVEVHAKQDAKFQYPDEELRKLLDPKVKAFFIVNPGNPFAVALDTA
ncbi:MAG TPA: aminotransferase class I/II-fold pyridoxal phosphate-dependent enzyme, partial [Candidatus Binatia bacterium]